MSVFHSMNFDGLSIPVADECAAIDHEILAGNEGTRGGDQE